MSQDFCNFTQPKFFVMTTIRIHKHSKTGRLLLELARMLSENHKEVEIIDSEKEEEEYPVSKNVPNEETLKILQENDTKKKGKGMNLKEFHKEIDSW